MAKYNPSKKQSLKSRAKAGIATGLAIATAYLPMAGISRAEDYTSNENYSKSPVMFQLAMSESGDLETKVGVDMASVARDVPKSESKSVLGKIGYGLKTAFWTIPKIALWDYICAPGRPSQWKAHPYRTTAITAAEITGIVLAATSGGSGGGGDGNGSTSNTSSTTSTSSTSGSTSSSSGSTSSSSSTSSTTSTSGSTSSTSGTSATTSTSDSSSGSTSSSSGGGV